MTLSHRAVFSFKIIKVTSHIVNRGSYDNMIMNYTGTHVFTSDGIKARVNKNTCELELEYSYI